MLLFAHLQLILNPYLDTLWIMEMYSEFEEAVKALKYIDFSTCALDEINVFETTIRYLGGFLSAYDLSDGKYPILLQKAKELGNMLYKAFDTPNRMPITRWKFREAAEGREQDAPASVLVAEIGSLTVEFTRLSQLTGDPRFYDAVQRIMDILEKQQNTTKVPGLWPVVVNGRDEIFNEFGGFTIGGMADSTYEYLPKVSCLLHCCVQL
jgi:mannosyl-oligosaccharide alpha-1,2-mannosidase